MTMKRPSSRRTSGRALASLELLPDARGDLRTARDQRGDHDGGGRHADELRLLEFAGEIGP